MPYSNQQYVYATPTYAQSQFQQPAYNMGNAESQNQNNQQEQFIVSTPNETKQVKQTYIAGRYVNEPKDIQVGEVPSDGNPAVFPLMDRSAIIVKELNATGTIDTAVYIRKEVMQQNQQQTQSTDTQVILDRLDNLERIIKKNRYYPTKKEGVKNGD